MSETDTTTKTNSITAPDAVLDKLPQTVEIKSIGPCKKHVKVTVDRSVIDTRFDEKYSELVLSDKSAVNGFRPGKAPRKIIEKRYKNEVSADVKSEVLMASLEQLADEQSISPLAPPELDPKSIFIPDIGPFVYEFDIEVRPEFDLPNYKGLKLRKPVHTFTDADVAKEKVRMLEPHGQIVPKPGENPTVELFDVLTVDLTIEYNGKELNSVPGTRIRVEKKLAFSDGIANDFGKKLTGAKVGDTRTIDIALSQEIPNPSLRGAVVQARIKVLSIKVVKLPELNESTLSRFDVKGVEQFDELVRVRLDRHMEYQQRQVARTEVYNQLAGGLNWDLPRDLLENQARKTLSRRVMEMRSSGMSDEQINSRARVLQMEARQNTAAALKEHFVLQKIAEIENLEIEEEDIDAEIRDIAERQGESYRKVRARMEKDDLIEAVATELMERKALDLVLRDATYEEYEYNPMQAQEDDIATSTADAVSEAQSQAPAEVEAKG